MQKEHSIQLEAMCQSSPKALWPYVADFNILGRVFGTPAIEAHSNSDGHTCKYVGSGLSQSWHEICPEWVEACWWQRTRTSYTNSLFMKTCETLQLDAHSSGTRLQYTLGYQTKSWWNAVLLRFVYLPMQQRRIMKCLRTLDTDAKENKAYDGTQTLYAPLSPAAFSNSLPVHLVLKAKEQVSAQISLSGNVLIRVHIAGINQTKAHFICENSGMLVKLGKNGLVLQETSDVGRLCLENRLDVPANFVIMCSDKQ